MSLGFGFGHSLLILLWDSLALLVPEAVAELLPRKLAAGGLEGEERHQAKARDRGIHMDRSKHVFLGEEGSARKSLFSFPCFLVDLAGEGKELTVLSQH